MKLGTKVLTFVGLIAVGGLLMQYAKFPTNAPYGTKEEWKHELHLSMRFESLTAESTSTKVTVHVNGKRIVNEPPRKSPWTKTIKVPQTSTVRLAGKQADALYMECLIFDNDGNILAENELLFTQQIECIASLL